MKKRIVICADGTWNHRDQVSGARGKRRPSNVTKLARAVRTRDNQDLDQVVFYHDGIGTGDLLDRFSGGALGAGMERNIRSLYRFILYNHEPGDELFFFGFSRGAFTVRSLVGFMHAVGLVEKEGDYYVPDLYHLYQRGIRQGNPEWEAVIRRARKRAECPAIRFVGVWDTVGALGAPGLIGQLFSSRRYRYHDVGLNEHVEHARHALAIDERRKPFRPTFWTRPAGWQGTLVQAWFPGCHTDVGGGFDPDGLANAALHWMVAEAEAAGLVCDHRFLAHFRPCFNSVMHNSLTPFYRLFGNGNRELGGLGASGEALHRSAMDRHAHAASRYSPPNLAQCVAGQAKALPVVDTAGLPATGPCEER